MAHPSTLFRFSVDLSDVDRAVYESLDFRVPRHPSEDDGRMVVRVLARLIFHEEGLEFGRGLSTREDAALWTHNLRGEVQRWIEVGAPSAERLHRASKKAPSLHVVTAKGHATLRAEWSKSAVHAADAVEIVHVPETLVAECAALLGRQNDWVVVLHEGLLSVTSGSQTATGELQRESLEAFMAARA
ncbi:MAG: YaeQ family protein [Myxococcota bacterium]